MRRIILRLTLAALMAAVMLVLAAGPAFAPDCFEGDCNPIERPSRAASLEGLGEAAERSSWGETHSGTTLPLEQISSNAQDPSTPGVTPGGGGFEP